MMLHIPGVLSAELLTRIRAELAEAAWISGRETAGTQAVQVKRNEQLSRQHPVTRRLQSLVMGALERHALFFSAALPAHIFPPMFNRYSGELNTYGDHVDNAVRFIAETGQRLRSDISCTLFLSAPEDYEGGDLVIEDSFGPRRVKLPAGDLILYPATSVHRVEPVTRGARVAAVFWVQSLVRSEAQRRLLFDFDMNLMRLRQAQGETPEAVALTGTYHNLLRLWAEP